MSSLSSAAYGWFVVVLAYPRTRLWSSSGPRRS